MAKHKENVLLDNLLKNGYDRATMGFARGSSIVCLRISRLCLYFPIISIYRLGCGVEDLCEP